MPSAATAAGRIRHAAIRGPDQVVEGGGRPGAPLRAREDGPVAGVVAAGGEAGAASDGGDGGPSPGDA